MRPFHNMSMWQGQDVVHSLGLKIKTAPLDAHTVRFGGGFFPNRTAQRRLTDASETRADESDDGIKKRRMREIYL